MDGDLGDLEVSNVRSAQIIMQDCLAIKRHEELKIEYGLDLIPKSYKSEVIHHIQAWGGIEAIDAWLETNDPGHALIRDIPGISEILGL